MLLSRLLAGVLSLAAPCADRQTQRFDAPAGTAIAVESTVGDVTVSGWDRADVLVEISRCAPAHSDPTRVEATAALADHRVVVRVAQRDGGHDETYRTSVVIHAPFAAAVDAIEMFEGRLVLRDRRGGVRARLEHGSVDADGLSGPIRLETRIGALRVRRVDPAAPLVRLRTFNGDVHLGFVSPPADARILALSLSGAIRSEIPLRLKTQFGPRFGEATLGTPDRLVSIDVVNGDIYITAGT